MTTNEDGDAQIVEVTVSMRKSEFAEIDALAHLDGLPIEAYIKNSALVAARSASERHSRHVFYHVMRERRARHLFDQIQNDTTRRQ